MPATRSSRMTTHTIQMESNRLRQRSGSQSNLLDMATDRRQTYGALRRSVSSSNLRTPHRITGRATTYAMQSPGMRTPSSVPISNIEQNRRMAGENAAKVIDLLQSNSTFFKSLNLSNSGLKSMTINQYFEIVSYLMLKISGKSLITKIRTNHETFILDLLQTLNYPYAVNKTCLKMPNAYQNFSEIVAILAFLTDLVNDITQYAVPMQPPFAPCERLKNDEYIQFFSSEVLRYYLEERALDEEGEQLVNGLIAIQMEKPGLTVNILAQKEQELRQKSIELQQNFITSDCEKYFTSIEQQYAEKECDYEKLQTIIAEKRKCLKMVSIVHDSKSQKLANKQAELKELMHRIEKQKYSQHDIKELTVKEMSIKQSIDMFEAEKFGIQAEASNIQIKLARYQKHKLDAIKKFNNFIYKLAKKLMQIRSMQQINVNEFTIDPSATMTTIQDVCLRLRRLGESCSIVKQQHLEQIEQNNVKLINLKSQYIQLTDKHANEMVTMQEANKKMDELIQKQSNFECNGSTSTTKLQRQIAEKIAIKQRITEEIVEARKKLRDLEMTNRHIFEDGERQAHEIIQVKQQMCKELDELNNFIDNVTNYFEKDTNKS